MTARMDWKARRKLACLFTLLQGLHDIQSRHDSSVLHHKLRQHGGVSSQGVKLKAEAGHKISKHL